LQNPILQKSGSCSILGARYSNPVPHQRSVFVHLYTGLSVGYIIMQKNRLSENVSESFSFAHRHM